MYNQKIGIRQLHSSIPAIAKAVAKGKSFVVIKHAKPIFSIHPLTQSSQKTYSLEDLKKLQFSHKNKNLSKEIDAIVYGV